MQLPALRQDLQIFPAGQSRRGAPTWRLYDPLRNRFFQLGEAEFTLLAHWSLGTADALLADAAARLPMAPDAADLEALIIFLHRNQLLARHSRGGLQDLATLAPRKPHWATWALHNYLFFRIPLANPDRFYAWLAPRVGLLYTRGFWMLVAAAGVLALYQITTQWDRFFNTFSFATRPGGVLWLLIALGVLKVAHEIGHGVTARRHGLRVPTTGVAFMVLWPVLYTDINEIWRTTGRRQRFQISVAGIAVELVLAISATLLWAMLPEGQLQSALFAVAAIGWVTSLFINMNPFMRFDGYYLLSDYLDYPNLHDAAFAAARHKLHRAIGLDLPPPGTRGLSLNSLAALGYATWLYRAVLFFGIALIIYHVFPKLLGAFLASVEIGWFILRPVFKEIGFIYSQRKGISRRGRVRLLALGTMILLICVAPWSSRVHAPAQLEAQSVQVLFAQQAARIATLAARNGQDVTAGDVLIQLESPQLVSRLQVADARLREAQSTLKNAASGATNLDQVSVHAEHVAERSIARDAVNVDIAALTLIANIKGRVTDMPPGLQPGTWVRRSQRLATVVPPAGGKLRSVGYVNDADYARLRVGQAACFYPAGDPLQRYCGTLKAIALARSLKVEQRALTESGGGPLPLEQRTERGEFLHGAFYRIEAQLDGGAAPLAQTLVGELQIASAAYNPLVDRLRRIVATIKGELAF